MIYDVDVQFDYRMDRPTDIILQIQAPSSEGQTVLAESIDFSPLAFSNTVDAEAGIGTRMLLRTTGHLTCHYRARVDVTRTAHDIETLHADPLHRLPAQAVRCLMPSRYCNPDEVQGLVGDRFDSLQGGARIVAIRDWISENFEYVSGASTVQTTAVQTATSRQGVCRDFAHVLIALARDCGIPARYVSVYSAGVLPQDFHAVAEVYLAGAWHLVDATGMARADQIIQIGVGLDAAEVSFLSSFGAVTCISQTVNVVAAL